MGSVLTTLIRGIIGVVATILAVALVWTLYVERDAVLAASAPVVGLVTDRGPGPAQGASVDPPAASTPADAGRASDAAPGKK